uniref:Secreted protein n=1 Tax=Nelumbo nucifera TaxID=4432 RepID=A0A822XEZ9_NELNU|nr:TPA_asm: hypothetical protein HUJ06_019935 [Nelumbo nucifera]
MTMKIHLLSLSIVTSLLNSWPENPRSYSYITGLRKRTILLRELCQDICPDESANNLFGSQRSPCHTARFHPQQ